VNEFTHPGSRTRVVSACVFDQEGSPVWVDGDVENNLPFLLVGHEPI